MSDIEFQEIFYTYQPKIQRYLTRFVGENEAEDLTQEVFVKVGQGLKNFRGESQLSTWIYKIAHNTALDKLRSPYFKNKSTETISESELEAEDQDTSGKKPLTDQKTIRKEMNACIRDFIEKLPQNYRSVMVLSEVEGNKEIAEILGISLDTVKIRLHRAKAKLKKELQNHCDFYRDEQNEFACDKKKLTD
jgi:RNA polymerase sigma-70 factor (ECF subfamily)